MKQNVLDSLPDSKVFEKDCEELTEEEEEEWVKRVQRAREKLDKVSKAINRKANA